MSRPNRPSDLERLTAAHKAFSRISASIAEPITDKLRPVFASISEDGRQCTTAFEIEVDSDMVNSGDGLHGGIGCFLIDYCSSTALLFVVDGWALSGVSHSINSVFHASAPLGSVIRIVSTVLAVGRRFANLEIKIVDSASGKLFVTGAQAKADVVRSKMSLDPLRLDESGSEGYVERVSSEFKAKQHSSRAKL